MKEIQKPKPLLIQLIILVLTFFCVLIAGILYRTMMPDEVLSHAHADLHMPENSRSVMSEVSFLPENARMEGNRFYPGEEDPQLVVVLPEEMSGIVKSLMIVFEEPFSSNMEYSLFYPQQGEFSAEKVLTGIISSGRDRMYVEIPEEGVAEFDRFRLDIEAEYTLRDIQISEEALSSVYIPAEHKDNRIWGFVAVSVFVVLEILFFFRNGLRRLGREIWSSRKSAGKGFLITAAAGLFGAAAARGLRLVQGKPGIGYEYAAAAFLCMLVVVQIRLLAKKTGPGRVERNSGISTGQKRWYLFGVILTVGLVLFTWGLGIKNAPHLGRSLQCILPFGILLMETVFFGLLFRKYVLQGAEGEESFYKIYCASLFLLAVLYMMVFLPMLSPDERTHYLSAYRIADLFLGKGTSLGDRRMILRTEDYALIYSRQVGMKVSYLQEIAGMVHPFREKAGFVVAESSLATNALVSYFPGAFGIMIGRILNFSGVGTYYTARFMNILFCTGVTTYVMKTYRTKKDPLFVFMGMPMLLQLMSSCSYDGVTCAFVILFVFQVFSLIRTEPAVSGRELLRCAIFGALMAPSKMVYFPLLLLVFLIPGKALGETKGKRILKRLFVIGSGLVAMVLISRGIRWLSSSTAVQTMIEQSSAGHILSWNGEQGYTIGYLLHDPVGFLFLCGRTLFTMADEYFFTMMGSRLARYDLVVPSICGAVSFLFFLQASNIREKNETELSGGQKVWCLLVCLLSAGGTFLALTLSWTPLSSDTILGIQGRYFLPLLPVLMWVLRDAQVSVHTSLRRRMLFVTVMMNIWLLAYSHGQMIFGTAG